MSGATSVTCAPVRAPWQVPDELERIPQPLLLIENNLFALQRLPFAQMRQGQIPTDRIRCQPFTAQVMGSPFPKVSGLEQRYSIACAGCTILWLTLQRPPVPHQRLLRAVHTLEHAAHIAQQGGGDRLAATEPRFQHHKPFLRVARIQ